MAPSKDNIFYQMYMKGVIRTAVISFSVNEYKFVFSIFIKKKNNIILRESRATLGAFDPNDCDWIFVPTISSNLWILKGEFFLSLFSFIMVMF